MEAGQYISKDMDHLGIVAGMCNRINLIEQVDGFVGDTDREVTVGQAVQALVLNGLGFVGRPLYLTPEFFRSKPVDMLIGEGVTAEKLNNHSLGRALDRLYEAGVTEVFAEVAAHAIHEVGIEIDFVHLDSTSFGLHGEYEYPPNEEAQTISITHGYSRDHRPDLKQVVLSLICTHQAGIPVWLTALSGNTADTAIFPEIIDAYIEQLEADGQPPYFVADAALYSASTIQKLGERIKWVTRVPASVALVDDLYQTVDIENMQPVMDGRYRIQSIGSFYGGVRQRWVLVYSEALYRRGEKQLRKCIAKERREAERMLRRP